MQYQEQLQVEQLNKQIFNNIISTVSAKDFIEYYTYHTQAETLEHFGLRTLKQLRKTLEYFNYDFSQPKPSKFKGKAAARSHESYVEAGKKSAVTQRASWANKSEEEREAWSKKQSEAHLNSPSFKEKITASNRAYRASLSVEEENRQNEMRSLSMKAWWANLSEEEKAAVMTSRFQDGQSYSQKDSRPNKAFAALLTAANIDFEREFCINRKLFDFKVGDYLIEINPTFTHNSTFTPFAYNKPLAKTYHRDKSRLAEQYGYKCIQLFEWEDAEKLINILSANKKIIYARQCEVKEVPKQEAIDFLYKYHLQNYAQASVKLGLYYNQQLVSIMTFGKPRYNKAYEWELIRYCSSEAVTGGAKKLFKYFIKNYTPRSIISYCDKSKFTGQLYSTLGFECLRVSSPAKHWHNPKTKQHFTDALVRQQGFSRLVNKKDAALDNLSTADNTTLLLEAGFVEVYDCGQATYVWKNQE
jgi:hypothetical protein